ncbi:hypothetical protein EYR41_000914 [Orbilia oligospora]|uniref:Uncharacterized protein n=1 Tax=Orbilia oligospora TaxID=2813651 RepID=A0A8H2E8T7_ORBOL|nr:hypothetical protein EYR41_000914 [Orbilia oligospora]
MATPAGRCHWTNETKDNIEKEEQTSTAFARIRCQSHSTLPRMASCYTISLVMPDSIGVGEAPRRLGKRDFFFGDSRPHARSRVNLIGIVPATSEGIVSPHPTGI